MLRPCFSIVTSSEQRLISARLKKMKIEKAISQRLVETSTATDPARMRSVNRPASISTSTMQKALRYQL